MPNPNYTTELTIPTAHQVNSMLDRLTDVSKKLDSLADLPVKVDRLYMQVESLNKDHSSLYSDMAKCQEDIRGLDKVRTSFETIRALLSWGGMGLMAGLVTLWFSLSTKLEGTNQQTLANKQTIESILVTQKDSVESIRELQDQQRDAREQMASVQAILRMSK